MKLWSPLLVILSLALPAYGQSERSQIDRALANPDFTWLSVAEGGVRLYYQPGSFAERHRVMLLRSAQGAVRQGLDYLEMDPDDLELRVLYVDDRSQMEALIGHTYAGLGDWEGHGVFLVANEAWRSFDTHEIAHVLSIGRWEWATEASQWMIEGLPIAIDGWCQTASVDRLASYLVSAGHWPGLAAFLADPRALGEVPGGTLGASLIDHLRRHYGATIIEDAWKMGLEAAMEKRDLDPAAMEAEWLEYLERVPGPVGEAEWKTLDEEGCG